MKIQIFNSILEIPEAAWAPLVPPEFPFAKQKFLSALERNHCVGPRTGWSPRFVTAWENDELLAALLLYEKTNSYGEYIFDFAWAEAFRSHGYEYYPKLVSAVPFTPATGPKILFRGDLSGETTAKLSRELLAAAEVVSDEKDMSSTHALFITPAEFSEFKEAGFFLRHSFQFHWKNLDYAKFDDFLADLRSKRRREILRERAQASGISGIKIERLTGDQIKPEHGDWMHAFYLSTVQKMGGFDYLTKGFFQEVFRELKENLLFVLATDAAGLPVAGAMNFFGSNALYGRHWGCLDEYKALHFEVCYYQGIEFSIERGFKLFEAGAQGEHKFQRGFLPAFTYSAHRIREPRLNKAIQDFCRREKQQLDLMIEDYLEHTPFQRR